MKVSKMAAGMQLGELQKQKMSVLLDVDWVQDCQIVPYSDLPSCCNQGSSRSTFMLCNCSKAICQFETASQAVMNEL